MQKSFYVVADFVCWNYAQARFIQHDLEKKLGIHEPIHKSEATPNVAKEY